MLLRFQFKAWFGILQSSILITCPSHLSLLPLIISSSFAIHRHIRQCLELHDIVVLCKERHERFLRRTDLLTHAVLHSLTAQYCFYSSIFFVVQ